DEFWRQKAHVKWVTDGERNSGYFHSVVKDRRRKLYIHRIQDDHGQWVTERAGIASQAITFFQAMFTADPSVTSLALDMIPRLVTDDDNDRLCAVPEMEEVKTAVFAMDSRSAAGPDGFSGAFYKAAWTIICMDLLAMVQAFFLGHDLTRSLTHTSIVLLPKKPNPVTFADFRPISLCNYRKKIITKIMVVRLASVLPRLLSPHQSGFVAGRSITNNILLAQEMCHGMRVDNEDVILKLDMMKAYDRVSWFFLMSVLRRFGFSETWIDLVYRAISNIWYSVIINGIREGFFHSTRGLQQGDPLSPSLFILSAEVLSRSLAQLYTDPVVARFTQPRD
ncbi:unnamed protein product, partial [Cuscuta campestris]